MLDVLSGGRLISGMVVGLGVEAFAYEVNPTFIRERYREAHDLIVRAWTEPGPFHFEGKHYDFRWVNVWPRPLQQPHPPIWIPGSGSMETIRFVAERRYPWIALPYSQFEVMKEHFDMLREYAATHCGYDVPPSQIGWPAMIYVAETDKQAREEFEPHFWYIAKKGLRLPREYMFPPGHTSVESLMRPGNVKRKFISLLSSWQEAEDGRLRHRGQPGDGATEAARGHQGRRLRHRAGHLPGGQHAARDGDEEHGPVRDGGHAGDPRRVPVIPRARSARERLARPSEAPSS